VIGHIPDALPLQPKALKELFRVVRDESRGFCEGISPLSECFLARFEENAACLLVLVRHIILLLVVLKECLK